VVARGRAWDAHSKDAAVVVVLLTASYEQQSLKPRLGRGFRLCLREGHPPAFLLKPGDTEINISLFIVLH
jgi:hypothetical protein